MRQSILYPFSLSCLFNLNGEIERFLVQNVLRDLGDILGEFIFWLPKFGISDLAEFSVKFLHGSA